MTIEATGRFGVLRDCDDAIGAVESACHVAQAVRVAGRIHDDMRRSRSRGHTVGERGPRRAVDAIVEDHGDVRPRLTE
jgi:hypothetical protein